METIQIQQDDLLHLQQIAPSLMGNKERYSKMYNTHRIYHNFHSFRSLELRRIIAGSLLIIVMILGLVGNTLTMAAVINYPKIRTVTIMSLLSIGVYWNFSMIKIGVWLFDSSRVSAWPFPIFCTACLSCPSHFTDSSMTDAFFTESNALYAKASRLCVRK